MMQGEEAFNEAVLAWLLQNWANQNRAFQLNANDRTDKPTKVLSVVGHGNDWAGGTEPGFYTTFSVEVRYECADGKTRHENVEGSSMESLWDALVISLREA